MDLCGSMGLLVFIFVANAQNMYFLVYLASNKLIMMEAIRRTMWDIYIYIYNPVDSEIFVISSGQLV